MPTATPMSTQPIRTGGGGVSTTPTLDISMAHWAEKIGEHIGSTYLGNRPWDNQRSPEVNPQSISDAHANSNLHHNTASVDHGTPTTGGPRHLKNNREDSSRTPTDTRYRIHFTVSVDHGTLTGEPR